MPIFSRGRNTTPPPLPRRSSSFFSSRLFVVGGVMVLVLVGIAFAGEFYRKAALSREINRIAQDIRDLKSDNTELEALIQYYQTQSFKERSAREQLGLTKRGEVVVSFPTPTDQTTGGAADAAASLTDATGENPARWWVYFFGSSS